MARPVTCTCGECQKCKKRVYMHDWYSRPGNAERQRESARLSRLRRIDRILAYDRAREKTPEQKARRVLRRAVKAGKISRGECERGVDCRGAIEAHHDDYSKPLEVRWLCVKHHHELHRAVSGG